ncbi:MAG TPA: DNA/RNA non-specific endonuclease [Candidatus Sericytochromatia bacterium]
MQRQICRSHQAIEPHPFLFWEMMEHQHPLRETIATNFKASPVGKKWVVANSPHPKVWTEEDTDQVELAIAVMMPNDRSVKDQGWKSFRVPVKRVERETGLNFLSHVSPQVQQINESKVDSQ